MWDIVKGKKGGEGVRGDDGVWYMEMWMGLVRVGMLEREDVVGYGRGEVYIGGWEDMGLKGKGVREGIGVVLDVLKNEGEGGVRGVLGELFLVYIEGYMEGKGRMGGLVLKGMVGCGGYKWRVVGVEGRKEYMKGLEKGRVEGDIWEFGKVIGWVVK